LVVRAEESLEVFILRGPVFFPKLTYLFQPQFFSFPTKKTKERKSVAGKTTSSLGLRQMKWQTFERSRVCVVCHFSFVSRRQRHVHVEVFVCEFCFLSYLWMSLPVEICLEATTDPKVGKKENKTASQTKLLFNESGFLIPCRWHFSLESFWLRSHMLTPEVIEVPTKE
jgi:hypothetical protein|tara:strand:- start:2020 stop:2526 length:507 start_codon:yes stop_codon:yes gene_type:complete